MKPFAMTVPLTFFVTAGALSLVACSSPVTDLEPTRTSSSAVVGGTTVASDTLGSAELLDCPNGTANCSFAQGASWLCSGNMIADRWFLTAHHCVTANNLRTGGTAVAANTVRVQSPSNSSWSSGIQIYRHPTLDVALVELGGSILSPSGAVLSTPLFTGTSASLANKTVYCQGFGSFAEQAGVDGGQPTETGAGTLRSATFTVLGGGTGSLAFFPNSRGMYLAPGDSGAPCFLYAPGTESPNAIVATMSYEDTTAPGFAPTDDQLVGADGFLSWAETTIEQAEVLTPFLWSGTGTPTIANNFTPTLGSNVIPIALLYAQQQGGNVSFSLEMLDTATNLNENYNIVLYNQSLRPAGSPYIRNSPQYFQGITYQGGWTSIGTLFPIGGAQVATNVSGFADGTGGEYAFDPWGLQTSSSSMCTGNTTGPNGPCIFAATSESLTNWASTRFGAEQVTLDSVGDLVYALDNQGRVWRENASGWTAFPTTNCTGGTVAFTQIAAKTETFNFGIPFANQEVVFGLLNGFVYEYGMTAYPSMLPLGCWSAFGGPSLKSIATDNGSPSFLYGYPSPQGLAVPPAEVVVWATDQLGRILYYDWH